MRIFQLCFHLFDNYAKLSNSVLNFWEKVLLIKELWNIHVELGLGKLLKKALFKLQFFRGFLKRELLLYSIFTKSTKEMER